MYNIISRKRVIFVTPIAAARCEDVSLPHPVICAAPEPEQVLFCISSLKK